ncbi:MAG: acyltransferase family protein [Paracoccaceae bacterium]
MEQAEADRGDEHENRPHENDQGNRTVYTVLTPMPRERYRPEIDGLRALAVLPVIFYHLSAALIPAGFLGVDVFFVISGYLITGLLVADLKGNRFTLWRFYERRARRILPALFLVIGASVLPAALLMLPGQHTDFGWAILAAIGFLSNLLYYQSTGYFMPSTDVMPLLHTWSLAVEEQFYLFFPPILYAAWRLREKKALVVVVALLGLTSLILHILLSQQDPAAAFYLLPARAWELMAGSLVALTPRLPRRVLAEVATIAGLSMIVVAYCQLGCMQVLADFPTLLPVCGTALFLWSGGQSQVGQAIAIAPLRGIGMISYSAYLWHWPLLAFWHLSGGTEITGTTGAVFVIGTLALATLTYQCVERPFRDRRETAPFPSRALVPFLGTCAVALTLFAILPLIPSAIGTRSGPTDAAAIEARLQVNYGLNMACEGAFTLDPACRTSDHPAILLWGDSFAMHLAPAIQSSGDWGGMIQMTKSSCAPILGLSTAPAEYAADWYVGCHRFNSQVLAWLAGADSIQIVVLSSTFNIMFNDLRRPDGSSIPAAQAPAAVRAAFLDTVERIQAMGKRVVVVSPTPATGKDLGQCLAAAELAGSPKTSCDFPLASIASVNQQELAFLHELADRVALIDLTTLICPAGKCSARIGDVFVFRDAGHLSIEGAEWLGRTFRFERLIRQATVQAVVPVN